MKVECVEQVELPFMLNIPTGDYPVGGGAHPYLLHVSQEQLAAYLDDGRFAIGSAETIKQQIGQHAVVKHWQPLRTIVVHVSSVQIANADIPLLDDRKLHEAMQSQIIGENITSASKIIKDSKHESNG